VNALDFVARRNVFHPYYSTALALLGLGRRGVLFIRASYGRSDQASSEKFCVPRQEDLLKLCNRFHPIS